MRIAIFGAGVVGVTTAWYLQKSGHDVHIYDRQPDVGLETSFANGGQISVSHAEPWAGPGVPMKAIKWMLQEDSPLLFRPRLDIRQWMWGLKFLSHCNEESWEKNTKNLISLGIYSRLELQKLRKELNLDYYQTEKGIIHAYTDVNTFNDAKSHALQMEKWGIDRVSLSADESIKIEPSLKNIPNLIGSTYTASDETGDAYLFTKLLAEKCKEIGVKFHFNNTLKKLHIKNNKVTGALLNTKDIDDYVLFSDAYIVALGSFSPKIVKSKCISDIYPAKGYSATYKKLPGSILPKMSITDESKKVVFTPVGETLRVAGTAEFNGYSLDLNKTRCEALTRATRNWFGENMVDLNNPKYWTGLRPATPNNTPVIGKDPELENLYFNTGHGTLGWTHACGSAKGLMRIINKESNEIDFSFLC